MFLRQVHVVSQIVRYSSLSRVSPFQYFARHLHPKYYPQPSDWTDEPEYPPIPSRYTPGFEDKSLPDGVCKYIHGQAEELLQIKDAKERLEKLAGTENKNLLRCRVFDFAPNTLTYKKYITKTHVVQENLPNLYDSNKVEDDLDSVSQAVKQNLALYHSKSESSCDADRRHNELIREVILAILSKMSGKYLHLLQCQYDEDVRMETFWQRGGFAGDDRAVIGRFFKSIVNIQFKGTSSVQIRTDLPLPEVLPWDDPLCLGPVQPNIYSPKVFAQGHYYDRRISVSGTWIGDPCEYTHLAMTMIPSEPLNFFHSFWNSELREQHSLQAAVTWGFACATSMALNHGFNHLLEVTHPFVSQSVVFDQQHIRFCLYQLNTLKLWMSDDYNDRRNLAWISPQIPLFTDNTYHQVNPEALLWLMKFLAHKPLQRGYDMKPLLDKGAPGKLINNVGEPIIEKPPIGRFHYPANAVYF